MVKRLTSTHLFKAGSYPEGDINQNRSHAGFLDLFKHFGQPTHCLHGDKVLRVFSVIHPCHEGGQDGGGEFGHLCHEDELRDEFSGRKGAERGGRGKKGEGGGRRKVVRGGVDERDGGKCSETETWLHITWGKFQHTFQDEASTAPIAASPDCL